MSQALHIQENEPLVRSVARVCLFLLLASSLFACSSSGSDDPNATAISVHITPNPVTVLQGRSVAIEVDVINLPANASVAGFSSDLPETVADIDITTRVCPSGVGTVSCQDWTITPGVNSIPGDYEVAITPLGATVSGVLASRSLTLTVLPDPPPATAPAIMVDSSLGSGVAGSISHSLNYALFITQDSRLWGYGDNVLGQVRVSYLRTDQTGTVLDAQPFYIRSPVPIGPPAWGWSAIATSGFSPNVNDRGHSFALKTDGTVWQWGRDPQGFISSTLVDIPGLAGISAISAINEQSWLALDGSGQGHVYGGGSSEPVHVARVNTPFSGARAIAGGTERPKVDQLFFTRTDYGNGYVLKADGTPARIYENYSRTGPDAGFNGGLRFLYAGDMVGAGWTNITAIAAGDVHFLALRSDGVVLAAGRNTMGRLGTGDTTDAPFTDDCTRANCDAIQYTNSPVQVAGLSSVTAIAAKADRSFALLADGTVWTWGGGIFTPVQVQNLDNVRKIGPGYAIRNDCPGTGGTLWAILFPSSAQPTAERVPLVGDLSGCTPPSFDLVLGTSTLNLLSAADQQMTSVNLTRTGYTGAVDLEVLDCPGNVQCTPSPDPIPGNATQSTVTIRTTNATPGNYVVTVRGSGGGVTREVFLELHIQGL